MLLESFSGCAEVDDYYICDVQLLRMRTVLTTRGIGVTGNTLAVSAADTRR